MDLILSGLTQTSLQTGFGVRIKRLKSRVLVQKPGFCVSPIALRI